MQISRLTTRLAAYFRPDRQRDLREQFYEGLCLVGGTLTLFVVVPVNAFQNLPSIINAFAAVFGLLSFALYVLGRQGRHYPGLYFVAVMATLNIAWFPNGGSHGSIPYYFIVAVCYAVVFFQGATQWALWILVLANVVALTVAESLFPGPVHQFDNQLDRFLDLGTGFLVSTVACVLMLWVVKAGYHRERERLRIVVTALTESEGRFASLFNVNPDAVFVMDLDTNTFVDVNEGFTRMTGWHKGEVVGRTGLDLNLWVDTEDRARAFILVEQRGQVHDFLARLRAKDGRVFWGSMSFSIMEQEHRRLLLLTNRDVTNQIDADRAVAESRSLLSTLIDSTDDLVWLVDPIGFHLTAFNKAFAAAVRETLEIAPLVGMNLETLVPSAHVDEWRGFFRRALDEGPFTVEYTVPGTSHVILHSFSAVRHDGTTTGVAVFGKDITEHKRAEAHRERMEAQLLEAQKMESLGSLAGGVAHDFNNMLGGIMGYADMLLGEETEPRHREYLEAILQAATRSSELTRKLLAFGRRGKNIVEPVELGAIARDSVTMLRPSFRQDVTVDLDFDATWTVDGDPSQLNQLVVNLCINANEAMPSGGSLTVRTADVTLDESGPTGDPLPAGEYVELLVKDSGVGMTDEVKARIFEPFFTTKLRGRAPGTGLGLATVYGIVHLHHGSITVESAPGLGATFTVYLPRGTGQSMAAVAQPKARTGHGLVLVVEDESLLRKFAGVALHKLGYDTVEAADGEEGISIFRERHKELTGVLLDLKMPKKDGREAFLAFREIDPDVPVLICSGFGDNEEAQGLISLGARGLLAKPYRVSQLADMLARFAPPARA